jgi:vacuolar-type H+-ATPase subunit E/Vma4
MGTVEGSIEDLTRAIMNEAQAECDDLRQEAKKKAEVIRQHARAEAERARVEILDKASAEAERLQGQAAATAQLKARSKELEQREQVLDQIFSTASSNLPTVFQRRDYPEIAVELVGEALRQLQAPSAQIRADEQTLKLLTPGVLQTLSKDFGVELSLGSPLKRGIGVIVQTPEGRLQYDNTLETRLERMKPALRPTVYHLLRGESQ